MRPECCRKAKGHGLCPQPIARLFRAMCRAWFSPAAASVDHRQQRIQRFLRVTIEHPRVVLEEQRVLDARIARALPPLRDKNLFRLPAFQHRHPRDRAVRILLRCVFASTALQSTIGSSAPCRYRLMSSASSAWITSRSRKLQSEQMLSSPARPITKTPNQLHRGRKLKCAAPSTVR